MSITKTQSDYITLANQVMAITQKVSCETETPASIKAALESQELLIPVVGEFSAGKSSLLNSFLGQKFLSVAVTPETAIATELRYSPKEYAEVVLKDGTTKTIAFDQRNDIQPEWMILRLYVNSTNLKNIEPVILVDMPGFDSPRDDHNQAIASYLDRGAHYIVLTPVDSGTVTASMIRQLQDIHNMNRDFSCFVSKANLRTEQAVQEVVEEVANEIQDNLDVTVSPLPIGKDGSKELEKIVKSINPDALIQKIYRNAMLQMFDEAEMLMNSKIAAFKNDRNKNQQAVMEIQEAIEKLEKRKSLMIMENQTASFEGELDVIVSAAGTALNSNVDRLVEMAMNGASGETLGQEMNSIVRTAVIPAANNVAENMVKNINASIQLELKSFNAVFEGLNVSKLLEKVGQMSETLNDSAQKTLMDFSKKMTDKANQKDATAVYKTIVGTIGLATEILCPVVEVILFILPDIIKFLTKNSKMEAQKASVRSQILNSIPKMKSTLRAQLKPTLQEKQQAAIEQITASFDSQIQKQRENIIAVQEAQNAACDVNQKIVELEEAKLELLNLKKAV
ncbi:MAG: dynamin family protein [Fibrobacteraceae bacterium]|nr:dynamin family protein [Fibrobacteraceae bacterium]